MEHVGLPSRSIGISSAYFDAASLTSI